MKSLSQPAAVLVNELRRRPEFMERLTGRAKTDVALLNKLREHPEPAVVPYLLPFLFDAPRSVVASTAAVLARVLAVASADDLLDLDDAIRRASSYYAEPWTVGWAAMKPVDVSRFDFLGSTEAGAVGVVSFHASGYVREAAVTRLDTLAGGGELPFLLLRLNDWVTPVAARAQMAVEHRLVPEYAKGFLGHAPLIERLRLSRRRDHGILIGRVYALLQQPAQRDVLFAGLDAPDRFTRRLCFRLAWTLPGDERIDVVRRALSDPDTVIRLEGVREARGGVDSAEAARLLPIMLADPYPPVRREGLALAAERLPTEASTPLRAALLDANAVVREVARFYLRRRGEITDFAAVYRAHLRPDARPRELASALAGLGEVGARGDAERLLPFLGHARASVRRSAVHSLGVLDGDARPLALVQALRDPAGSVSRAARDQLRGRANRVVAEIHDVLRTSNRHATRHALTLLWALGKWDSLPYLLEAAANRDAGIRSMASDGLDAWVVNQNRSRAQPTRAQIQAIRSALEAYHVAVERRIEVEIRSILKLWEA